MAEPWQSGPGASCSHKAARSAAAAGSCSLRCASCVRRGGGRSCRRPRAGWQLEWVRELPPPPLLPPPPPPRPFAAERRKRGGAAGAAMEPDSVIEDKTIELMVSAARWPSILPAGWRPGGLPTLASAPGQPSFPAVWARPAPCYGWLLTPPALGPARTPLPAPPPHPPLCRAPASLRRPCLAPAGATPQSRLAITLFLEGDFFSLDSSGQACIALSSRAQAEVDGGGR